MAGTTAGILKKVTQGIVALFTSGAVVSLGERTENDEKPKMTKAEIFYAVEKRLKITESFAIRCEEAECRSTSAAFNSRFAFATKEGPKATTK